MKHFEVVTVGAAVKDIMILHPLIKHNKIKNLLEIPAGGKIPVPHVFVNYGGGAMNVAVGLNNFGIKTAPMVCVGKDVVGKEIYSHLRKEGIDPGLIQADSTEATGFSIVLSSESDREHVIFTRKGASSNVAVKDLSQFSTEWFYIAALDMEDWTVEADKLMRQTKKGVKIAWNPGVRQLNDWKKLLKFLPFAEVLILNRDEAEKLVKNVNPKISKASLKNSRTLLAKVLELGALNVVITQGSKGVIALDEHGQHYIHPALSITHKIVDTVGAGDAFSSGFLAALIRWEDFGKAIQVGLRNSANVLYRVGAQNGLLKIKL
jgi:ribokinase